MVSSDDYVLQDLRIDPRVKENRLVSWQVGKGAHIGRARVRNVSRSGMLIETNSSFEPYDHCVFSFDADLGEKNFIPRTGRLVWHKRKSEDPNRHLCGVQFVRASKYVKERLETRIEKGVRFQDFEAGFKKILHGAFFAAIIGLAGLALWLNQDVQRSVEQSNQQLLVTAGHQAAISRDYGNLYNEYRARFRQSQIQLATTADELSSTRRLYEEGQTMLVGVREELANTKAILAQTQTLLQNSGQSQALQQINEQETLAKQAELKETLASLQAKNDTLTQEMKVLEDQLLYYAGDVNSEAQGRDWLNMYRDRVKKVKARIKHFRRQTRDNHVSAQKEMDRIKMVLGNNGYFIKNGQNVEVDMKRYNNVSVESVTQQALIANTVSAPQAQKVDINVEFVE